MQCSIKSCSRVATAKGLCQMHYMRLLRGGNLDAPIKRPKNAPVTLDWIFDRCEKKDSGCLEWRGLKNHAGYPRICFPGRGVMIGGRSVYTLIHGEIPPGKFVCHTCDNPSCLNPDHLFVGSPKENTSDMFSKGRNNAKTSPESFRRNENHPSSKLSVAQVLEIRKSNKTRQKLADEYGVSKSAINAICLGKTWRL